MKNFLITHRLAVFGALLVGVVYLLPIAYLMPHALGSDYKGVLYLSMPNEDFYTARIHEILDGHGSDASVYLYEYKNAPTVLYPVNEWIYALPTFIFGLSNTIVASNFVLPAALFLLSYFFIFQILGKKEEMGAILTALAGGLLVTFGAEFVNYSYELSLLHGGQAMPMMWTRIVNPIVGAVLLNALLLLLWNVWEKKWPNPSYTSSFGMPLAAGLCLGAMVGYFFSFGIGLAILGILFLLAIFRKEYDVARNLIVVGVTSMIVDSWWWYHVLISTGGQEGRARALLSGMSFTHTPVLNKALLVATLISGAFFCYTYLYKRWREHLKGSLFSFAILVGCWVAYNQQIITGREIWYYHFSQYSVPLGIFSVLISAYYAFNRHRFLWLSSVTLLCAVSVASGLYSLTSYVSDVPWSLHMQTYAPVVSWIESNAEKDCVVLVDPANPAGDRQEQENTIPAYTKCNVYSIDWAADGIPPDRAEHNFLLRLRMSGVTVSDASEYMRAHEDDVRGSFYSDWYEAFGKGMEPWISDRIDLLAKDYQSFMKIPLEGQIKKYRVDYVLSEEPLAPKLLAQLPDLELAASPEGYYIYQFRKDLE